MKEKVSAFYFFELSSLFWSLKPQTNTDIYKNCSPKMTLLKNKIKQSRTLKKKRRKNLTTMVPFYSIQPIWEYIFQLYHNDGAIKWQPSFSSSPPPLFFVLPYLKKEKNSSSAIVILQWELWRKQLLSLPILFKDVPDSCVSREFPLEVLWKGKEILTMKKTDRSKMVPSITAFIFFSLLGMSFI